MLLSVKNYIFANYSNTINIMETGMALPDLRQTIIEVRDCKVMLDADLATLYGVATREINQAVRNNPSKFPDGYVFELTKDEVNCLRSKNLITNISTKSRVAPKAFTEKGLYMLATILKSSQATQTTIAIIETFAKLRELSRAVSELVSDVGPVKRKSLMHKSGAILSDILDSELSVSDTETSIELNLAVLKFKHTVKRKNKE